MRFLSPNSNHNFQAFEKKHHHNVCSSALLVGTPVHEHKALLRIHTHFSIRRHLLPHRLNSRFDVNLSIKRLASSGWLHSSHLLSTPTPTPTIASILRPALCSSTLARRRSPSHPSLLRRGSRRDDKRPSSRHPLLPCISRPLRNRILLPDRTSHAIPDVFMTPAVNMFASYHPNSLIYRPYCLSDGREPPAAVFWRAAALDVAVCVLWYVGVWRFASLLQAWLNPNFQPKAGVVYRPFTTAYGFEVVWTSRGLVGCVLQAVMMRPVRILNSYIFACGADGVRWLRRL